MTINDDLNETDDQDNFGAYRLERGWYHEDGSPSVLAVLGEGVSREFAYALIQADQIRYWNPHDEDGADGAKGVWDYDVSQFEHAVVRLDGNGEPIWSTDDDQPEPVPEVDFDDIVKASGIKRRVLALGDIDEIRELLEQMWASGTAVVSYYDDTTTDTSEEQDAAQLAERLEHYGYDFAIRVSEGRVRRVRAKKSAAV